MRFKMKGKENQKRKREDDEGETELGRIFWRG